jgi:diaminopimelate epimerase
MKAGTVFYKMTGSGNDFLVFDGRYTRLSEMTPEAVRAACDRRHGVGADGAILLDPSTAPQGTHFFFHFFNRDGSRGPMCGNGALCATRMATLIELAPAGGEVRFATRSGVHVGTVSGDRPRIRLPDTGPPQQLAAVAVEKASGEGPAWLVHPSVPHLVVPVPDVTLVQVEVRGPRLRSDAAVGPEGANVNWISRDTGGGLSMRTFERGVEGETLACGTGAVACAVVLEEQGVASPPVTVWTRSGLPLEVSWRRAGGSVTEIELSGEGRLVFRGILNELPIRS